MRTFLLPLLLLAALASSAAPASAEVAWRRWDAGLKEAAASGRPIVVDVYTDWCGWCKRMDRDVYSRPDVRDYLAKRFVAIRLNAEAKTPANYRERLWTEQSLAGAFRVTGYPTTVFLRSDGGHLVNVPGFVPADRFLTLLRYVGEGHLERGVPFDEFSKKPAPKR
jgi:thioredoxin-related protein